MKLEETEKAYETAKYMADSQKISGNIESAIAWTHLAEIPPAYLSGGIGTETAHAWAFKHAIECAKHSTQKDLLATVRAIAAHQIGLLLNRQSEANKEADTIRKYVEEILEAVT